MRNSAVYEEWMHNFKRAKYEDILRQARFMQLQVTGNESKMQLAKVVATAIAEELDREL